MSLDIPQPATALIDHIQTQFCDGHRRALPKLLILAAVVEARGIEVGLGDELRAIGNALDQHMFKEEMRLFPMMEKGVNTLIGHLIEDLHRAHVAQENTMDEFRARPRSLAQTLSADSALLELIHGVDDLATELARHTRAADEELTLPSKSVLHS